MKARLIIYALILWAFYEWTQRSEWWFDNITAPAAERKAFGEYTENDWAAYDRSIRAIGSLGGTGDAT